MEKGEHNKLTVTGSSVIRSSCLIRLQKPLRWLINQAYQLFQSGNGTASQKDVNSGDLQLLKLGKPSPRSSATTYIIHETCSNQPVNGSLNNTEELYDNDEIYPRLLDLPVQIRQYIYNLIEGGDILSLRLTCSSLKEDVDSYHGLSVRIHDGRMDCEKTLKKFGIAQLKIEQLVTNTLDYSSLFPRPQLLKTLIISGSISSNNLEFILGISNLEEWTIQFHFFGQLVPISCHFEAECLKIFRIISTSPEISSSLTVKKSIQDVLNYAVCPNLVEFHYHIMGLTADLLQSYHSYGYEFITRNDSLRKVDVELRQIGTRNITANLQNMENTVLSLTSNELQNNMKSRITMLQVNIDGNIHSWYPLLDSQSCLRILKLQMSSQSWNRLILTLNKNAKTLSTLIVSDLCSTSQDGITAVPVDFGLLRDLRLLQVLEIHHIDMESRGLEPPYVLRTSSLPQTLKSVKLCHLRLKPYQAMFLLVKLPILEELDLECWSDTEGTLAGFLAVVTFLVKFDITTVKSMVLLDSRRKMENRWYEINKLRNTLCNQADITQTNSELYSKLQITRF